MLAYVKKEHAYFQKLGTNVQKFFLSCMLSGFADPVLYAFLTAFLFRETNNIIYVSFYYVGFYIGLPFAFFCNGMLLRYFLPQILYWIGTLIEGFIVIAITLIHVKNVSSLLLWGFGFGIGAGFFWANRNFLTLRVVNAEKRMYYGSLESGVGTFINILAPLLSGGIIVLLTKFIPSGLAISYQILAWIALVILFLTGLFVQTMEPLPHVMKVPLIIKNSQRWNLLRLFIVNSGVLSGILIFFPTLMVFTFLGKEGTLGYIQSLVSAISAFVVLAFASKITNKHALFFLGISILFLTFGSAIFGILFSSLGVLVYLLSDAVGIPFSWAPYNTISFNAIDSEQAEFGHPHFAYIFDQELFLNIGRLLGIGVFLWIAHQFGTMQSLRYSPFILAILQIGQLFFAKLLIKET